MCQPYIEGATALSVSVQDTKNKMYVVKIIITKVK